MGLGVKQIQVCMDSLYKKWRDQGKISKPNRVEIGEFLDILTDNLTLMDQREGKNKKGEDKQTENQVKMIKALRMNNPLWDVE